MAVTYHHHQNYFSRTAPKLALPIMFGSEYPTSLLDVGCGLGAWVGAALDLGVSDAVGIDGADLDPKDLLFPAERFTQQDLSADWDLGRRFDVLLSLEVAEHLDEVHARIFIRALTRHSDRIYFSAASPGQPGEHHVNCRWPAYWQALFNDLGYVCSDAIRWAIWEYSEIEPWYRQNMFQARRNQAEAGREPRLRAAIHPAMMRYLESGSCRAEIEQGNMSLRWYAALPIRAAYHKISRRLRPERPDDGADPLKPAT